VEGGVGVVAGSARGSEVDIPDNDFGERERPFVLSEPSREGCAKRNERGSLGGGREVKGNDKVGFDPQVGAGCRSSHQDANGIPRDEGKGEEDRRGEGGVSHKGNTTFGRSWEWLRGGEVAGRGCEDPKLVALLECISGKGVGGPVVFVDANDAFFFGPFDYIDDLSFSGAGVEAG
jgi:hypothetical protein